MARPAASVFTLALITGCALLPHPTMRDISAESGLDLLSRMLTALDASDFDYFYSCFDIEALSTARGLTPVSARTLPHVKAAIRSHYDRLQEIKSNMRSGLKFYGAVGTRVGMMQMSVTGALSSTPLDGYGAPPGAPDVLKDRGYWLISVDGRSVKIRLRRSGVWRIEDIEW